MYNDLEPQVQATIWSTNGSKASLSEGVEASVIYLRFKATASELKGIVHQRISEFSKKEAHPSLTRSGCAYLI
ncbi:hypothetical protein K2173_006329 [Erythroxylum novogranatense]|uniref:Uncharacterized protein n=1 Tax=Erythroxylum novogranatense TaxID=1862640 RepID=A0AAV8UBW5_9ROSI|nr:hypothetical protein K2173_006329 [Erythroxylum novogranatense]